MTAAATATSNRDLDLKVGEFDTLTDALDYAALGETGFNFYSPRGELQEAVPYSELRARAVDLASRLVGAGFARGMRFAILAETHSYFPSFFFGCQYAGLIPVPLPLNIHMGGRAAYVARLRGMLRESGAGAVVAQAEMLEFLQAAAEGLDIRVGTPDDFLALPASAAPLRPFDYDGPCYIQYSSGSTSAPRGVFISQKAITSNARGIGRHGMKVVVGDRATSWLPLYHDMGLVGFCITPMMAQVSVDYLATASFARRPLVWLKLMTQTGGTISFSPTFGYDLCARRGLNGSAPQIDLSRWRIAGIGGEMVRGDVLSAFAEVFGEVGFDAKAFFPSYGLAESTLAVSFPEVGAGVALDRVDKAIFAASGRAVPLRKTEGAGEAENARARSFVLCGKALPGHRVEVRDGHDNRLPDRHVGRVMVKGPSVMAGYFENPARTAACMSKEGWLNTGDLGYLLDGQVVITGREKDLILQNGRNIWPQDIEWGLEKLDEIRSGDVACFAIEDDDGHSEVVVVTQCRIADTEKREELSKKISALVYRTSGVHCHVVLVPTRSLSFTSSGKLSRAAVKRDYLAGVLDILNEDSLPLHLLPPGPAAATMESRA